MLFSRSLLTRGYVGSLLTRGYVERLSKIAQQFPLVEVDKTRVTKLVKSLEFPMPLASDALGIHQSDVIIRSALVAAIADMRANPWLLDYVFASLPKDDLTWKDYGEKSVQRAKEWFLKTDIPVSLVPRIDEGRWPRITISLADSQETENTLGDINEEPIQYVGEQLILHEAFTPVGYEIQTGKITLQADVIASVVLAPNMYVVDRVGVDHPILRVDRNDIYIAKNTIVDLRDAKIKSVKPAEAVHLESAAFKETYHIGVHVGGEPVYLTWLHSIVAFILLRYREALLEARGLERTFIVSSDFRKEDMFEGELVFSRYITLSGVVRHFWPKAVVPVIDSISNNGLIKINPANKLPVSNDDVKKADALWVGENDDTDGIG